MEALASIRDVIKGFVEGTVDRQTAESQWRRYSDLYADRLRPVAGKKPDHVKSIFSYHNIANFAKVTALFRCYEGLPALAACSGDERLLPHISDFIAQEQPDNPGGSALLGKSEHLDFWLHWVRFDIDFAPYVLAAVSSSRYFTDERFARLSLLMKQCLSGVSALAARPGIDLQQETLGELAEYFNHRESDRDHRGFVFVFPHITAIFGHLGLRMVKAVSSFILTKLQDELPGVLIALSLDFRTYACIVSGEIAPSIEKQRIDFVYNGITLPYVKKTVPIGRQTMVRHFLESVHASSACESRNR